MPAGRHFDERHLRDVALAQSEQIRAGRRFSGLEILTRPMVALAAVIAIVALALGIEDYVEQQNAKAPAGTVTPTLEHTKSTRPKKTTSAKRAYMSATEATAEKSQNAADEMEKPLISEESSDAGAKASIVKEIRPNPLKAQATHDEAEAATHGDNGSSCLPLPNGTQPGDVDAPYYFGWAGQYCGRDLNRPSAPPKVPASRQSKR